VAADRIRPAAEGDPGHPDRWAAVDLRRLRAADPATDALATAFGAHEIAEGWTLNVEREDVCPVIRLPEHGDLDTFLSSLGKKQRHEIRRKVRRAEAAGEIDLVESTDPVAELDAFIELHQARWGERGLFPANHGGDQSRVFVRRLFELFAPNPPAAEGHSVHLSFLTVGGRRIGAAIHFETPGSLLYYNAGIDPDARELSPGVVLLERLVRRAMELGKCRVDLLRGDEAYKYEWGATDEPVQRILVRRTAAT
jgi:CelD/BcsL family acetyltransferase involved in cellulose biosynthesis